METKILKNEKDHMIMQLDNQTIAELLRVYLNKDSAVSLAVWKREHPDEPVILELKTKAKTAKKALDDAMAVIEKETSKYLNEFKKAV